MCGIIAYRGVQLSLKDIISQSAHICHRGPDNTSIIQIRENIIFGFHRLSINGIDSSDGQPMERDGIWLICNGEIYNFEYLKSKYKLDSVYNSKSDCEIIIHLYIQFGIQETLQLIDGEFAFALYDSHEDDLFIARDYLGIRSLYMSDMYDEKSETSEWMCASEMKGLDGCQAIRQFPPGCFWSSKTNMYTSYFTAYSEPLFEYDSMKYEYAKKKIHDLLYDAVKRRILMSDRGVGCLLSGGLDSSLVTSIACKVLSDSNKTVNTYAIGLEGSVDLHMARKVADHLGTCHHECVLQEHEFTDAIKRTIYTTESFCTTTIRASIGNMLISEYVKQLGKDAVLLVGDMSDEIFGSYRGLGNANSAHEFMAANKQLVDDVHFFDVLRSDKTISSAGLEARVPFSDKKLVTFVMSLDPRYKMFGKNGMIEKQILREAFEGYLPYEALYRKKEAFSDGVSQLKRSLFEIIREYIDTVMSDEEYKDAFLKYEESDLPENQKPYDKESLYYRKVYEEFFGDTITIPYYWKQPCSNIMDPSARLLKNYDYTD